MNPNTSRPYVPTYLENDFRQLFRNLNMPDRIRNLDTARWVRYCKEVGATTVFLDIQAGYAYWRTQLIPRDPVLGDRDLGEELARAARRHGLKFCFYLFASGCNSIASDHPDWHCISADGGLEARNWGNDSIFCFSHPGFREHRAAVLREIATRYRPHGFFLDTFVMGFSACYCASCEALYREQTGRSLPHQPDWSSTEWYDFLDWRDQQQVKAARYFHDVIHGVDPKIAIVWNCGQVWHGWYAAPSPAKAGWLDFACAEEPVGSLNRESARFRTFTYGDFLAWSIGITRSFQSGRRACFYHYFQPDSRLAEAVSSTQMAIAAGGTICMQEHFPHAARVLREVRVTEPYLTDSVSAADVALHFSARAHRAYYRPDNYPTDLPFYHETGGVYQGLLAVHALTDFIHDDGLETDDLSRFRALVLPNSVYLSPTAMKRLQDYVEQGGHLLASHETGLRDRYGRRMGHDLLWAGSGVRFRDDIVTVAKRIRKLDFDGEESDIPADPDQFLVFDSRAKLKAWIGEDISLVNRPDGVESCEGLQLIGTPSCHLPTTALEIEADDGWEVLFRLRYRRSKEIGWQECPAAITRRLGRGRITYVTFQIGTLLSARFHPWWRHLVARLLTSTAGHSPVRVEAPACVKVFLWHQPNRSRYILHLVNELSTEGRRDLQRETRVPVPARVRIALPGLSRVRHVIGREKPMLKKINHAWTATFSGLLDRAVLVCDYTPAKK